MVKFNERIKKEQQDMKNPQCGEDKTVKNGSLTDRKPKYKCKVCGRQFCEKRIASNALIVHLTT